MDWTNIWNVVKDGGGYVLALIAVVALARGDLVPKYVFLEERKEKLRERSRGDRWEAIALRGTWTAEAATKQAEEEAADKKRLSEAAKELEELRARGESL